MLSAGKALLLKSGYERREKNNSLRCELRQYCPLTQGTEDAATDASFRILSFPQCQEFIVSSGNDNKLIHMASKPCSIFPGSRKMLS
jgi:hypothetical protein